MYLPSPSAKGRYNTRSMFKWKKTDLNQEFSFYHYWRTQSALWFTHSSGWKNWIHVFLAQNKTQAAVSRIWTLVKVSISYKDCWHAKLYIVARLA